MAIEARVFWSAFGGKVVGGIFITLFIAVCAAFGFGPDKWAAIVLGLPTTPLIARIGFIALGLLAVGTFYGPVIWRWLSQWKIRWPLVRRQGSGIELQLLNFHAPRGSATEPTKNPADTFIILSVNLDRSSWQRDHPSWELHFIAFNGGRGTITAMSVRGTIRYGGERYPAQPQIVGATQAKYGEVISFTLRQAIDKADIPKDEPGQNHVVLGLFELVISVVARDPMTSAEETFRVPLPLNLQYPISPEALARFYHERLDTEQLEADVPENIRAPIIERDTWLYDAIARALLGKWGDISVSDGQFDLTKSDWARLGNLVNVQVRQLALDGALPIWGRDLQSDPYRAIPKEYWETHNLDWFSFLHRNPEQLKAEPTPDRKRPTVRWHSLMTSRAATEKAWP